MTWRSTVACLALHIFGMLTLPQRLDSRPVDDPTQQPQLSEPVTHVDIVGHAPGKTRANSTARTANVDTIWIADWTFEGYSGACDDEGWVRVDNRVPEDTDVYWRVDASFDGTGEIQGRAAVLGATSPCWEQPGYCNGWYQAIRIPYRGGTADGRFDAELAFDYVLDGELEYDFLIVEIDSACASFARHDVWAYPDRTARDYRTTLLIDDVGLNTAGRVEAQDLSNFSNPDVEHCLYIGFSSDGGFAPCDGQQETTLGVALVIDNVEITGEITLSEDFESDLDPDVSFVNLLDSTRFGSWGRLHKHVTDNDLCTENTSCSWLWTDHTTPLLALDPDLAYGPGGYVVRNWLDESVVSPWVSLASVQDAEATVIQFRRFPGNRFVNSRIVANWSVRGRKDVGGEACVSPWGHAHSWNSLSSFAWTTPGAAGSEGGSGYDMSYYFDPQSTEIQIRHRVSDWQRIADAEPPAMHLVGPGPYTGRTRIGRFVRHGPRIWFRPSDLPQDAFPDELNPHFDPSTGQRFRPTTDRFGTAAFSLSRELTRFPVQPVIGDSIVVEVTDERGAGGITLLDWYGAIVAGPHRGKAPPPHIVGASGFFRVPASQALTSFSQPQDDCGVGCVPSPGVVHQEGWFFVDLDDFYLRGGDVLNYFWLAADASGGWASSPAGLSAEPASLEEAQDATDGLYEVSILPTIDWDAGYLARVAADPHGKVEPTAEEIAGSEQAHRILYAHSVNPARRTGDVNRTAFMFTLDRLGYRGQYDVYDRSGYNWSSYNQNYLGSRATVEQATGYALIVDDTGVLSWGTLPDGSELLEGSEVDQIGWYQRWLDEAAQSEAGQATLWVLGENILEGAQGLGGTFYTDYLGASLAGGAQQMNLNPDVEGQASFDLAAGSGACNVDFTGQGYTLVGACPVQRGFDALGVVGSGVVTHAYVDPAAGAAGSGAIVMNSDPAQKWNTIVQSHPWFDIHDRDFANGRDPRNVLAEAILSCVLPASVVPDPTPTDVPGEGGEPGLDAAPAVTTLHANSPNPFNPMTVLRFDLARAGHVTLRIYNVSGRLVRSLINDPLPAERHAVTWDGLDDAGRPVPSGVLLYRLEAPDYKATRKMVLVR